MSMFVEELCVKGSMVSDLLGKTLYLPDTCRSRLQFVHST